MKSHLSSKELVVTAFLSESDMNLNNYFMDTTHSTEFMKYARFLMQSFVVSYTQVYCKVLVPWPVM